MSDYEIGHARGDQESRLIREGVEAATTHVAGPWEFGHYIERYDGPAEAGVVPSMTKSEHWTPLIYEAECLEDAEREHVRHRIDMNPFRNSRIVRRAVSPWEVFG